MDSIISLGQKNTLAEYMILSGAENRPPMLDKDLYDSWKSRMELYMQNKERGRMILESFENDPLIWPTIEENGVTRTKKYAELSTAKKIQVDCDMKATNIILQGLVVLVFSPEDDPLACLNKEMAFLTAVASSRVTVQQVQGRHGHNYFGYKSNAASSRGNNASGHAKVVKCYNCQGVPDGQATQTIIPKNTAFQTEYLDAYDSDCDDISNAKAVLMASIFNYGSDVILEAPHSKTYLNDMENQRVHAMQDFEQTPVADVTDNEITSLAVPVFSPGDDLIACLYKAKAFLTVVASSRFPSTSNQLRTSSNLRNQATIQDGKVTVQQVQERQRHIYFSIGYKSNASSLGGNNDKAMLAEAQEAGQILDEEKLAFLADPGVPDGQATQTIILNNAAFQTGDLDTDISNVKAVLMANISNYGSNVILEVPHSETYLNDMENQTDEAFWYHMLNPSTKSSVALTVKIEAPKELLKVSLVNESLKNLKLHLANFDEVVKIMTTPNARTKGE
nr:hypothetical protein [Tanacetum cinerariifolium]